jgi:hypothetical protein
MAYDQLETLKVSRPDTPEGYMIINARDYRAGATAWEYAQGLAYDPSVYPPYVEPILKAPAASPEPAASHIETRAEARASHAAAEKK